MVAKLASLIRFLVFRQDSVRKYPEKNEKRILTGFLLQKFHDSDSIPVSEIGYTFGASCVNSKNADIGEIILAGEDKKPAIWAYFHDLCRVLKGRFQSR